MISELRLVEEGPPNRKGKEKPAAAGIVLLGEPGQYVISFENQHNKGG